MAEQREDCEWCWWHLRERVPSTELFGEQDPTPLCDRHAKQARINEDAMARSRAQGDGRGMNF